MPRDVTPRRVTSVGQSLKAREEEAQLQVTRLRQALEAKQRRLELANQDLSKLKVTCEELKVQHDAERPELETELAELREETRHLQASSSDQWKHTRKMQASFRKAEERSEVQMEEYVARQRQLEQQNIRLRKTLAALRSQLFSWKHRRSGVTMPRCEPAAGTKCDKPDSCDQMSATPPKSVTPRREDVCPDEKAQMLKFDAAGDAPDRELLHIVAKLTDEVPESSTSAEASDLDLRAGQRTKKVMFLLPICRCESSGYSTGD
eukprot:Skav236441  [mRNA]  locus=scaffold2857:186233:189212:+ [translate_table: standard]